MLTSRNRRRRHIFLCLSRQYIYQRTRAHLYFCYTVTERKTLWATQKESQSAFGMDGSTHALSMSGSSRIGVWMSRAAPSAPRESVRTPHRRLLLPCARSIAPFSRRRALSWLSLRKFPRAATKSAELRNGSVSTYIYIYTCGVFSICELLNDRCKGRWEREMGDY